MSADTIDLVLAVFREPSRIAEMRERPLPDDVAQIIRLAAGEQAALDRATESTRESAETMAEAAVFFLQQVLFAPGADSYRVLGSAPEGAQAQLRENYRWLMKWLHPDRNEDGWEAVYADRVNVAWQDLKTPDRRADYDRRVTLAPAAPMSTEIALRSRPPQRVAAGPMLSGYAVRRLPAIVLATLGVFAVAVIGLMYWSQMQTQRQLAGVSEGASLTEPRNSYPRAGDTQLVGDNLGQVAPAIVSVPDAAGWQSSPVAIRSIDEQAPITAEGDVAQTEAPKAHSDVLTADNTESQAPPRTSNGSELAVVSDGWPESSELAEHQSPAGALPVSQDSRVVAGLNGGIQTPTQIETEALAEAQAKAEARLVAAAQAVAEAQVKAEAQALARARARAIAEAQANTDARAPAAAATSATRSAPVETRPVAIAAAEPGAPSRNSDLRTAAALGTTNPAASPSPAVPVAVAVTPIPALALAPAVPEVPADGDTRALIKEFASAYAAGDLRRFDRLFSRSSPQGRGHLGMRNRFGTTDMRFLEIQQLRVTVGDRNTRASAQFRDTYVPRGERRAVTETGTIEWIILLDDGSARIAELARAGSGS